MAVCVIFVVVHYTMRQHLLYGEVMKKAITLTIAALLLTGCGSNAPAELSKPQKLNKWIDDAGYECASWKKVSDDQSVCHLEGGDSLSVHLDEDPAKALGWYFDDASWVGGVKGENWFIPCMSSVMDACGDVASAADVTYLPNPEYLNW